MNKPVSSGVGGKTYGTVSADRQKAMTGLEFVQGLVGGTRRAVSRSVERCVVLAGIGLHPRGSSAQSTNTILA